MNRSGRPDAAQRAAAEQLEVTRRVREVEEALLARAPENDVEPSLDQIRAVMELLGDPQHAFPMVHLTGTNGKTSTTRMVDRLLRELGLSTGRFTSPHLHDLRERIAFSGEPISPERLVATYDDVAPFLDIVDERSRAAGVPRMNYFQAIVALGYAAFADAPVDVAVVEVGLGGAWDATNVADGQVAVMAPVALDHQRLLGSTVEEIATEKSGIIKPGAIGVVGLQEPEVLQIFRERAEKVGAQLRVEGEQFGLLSHDVAVGGQLISVRGLAGDYPDLFLPLHGAHQAQNAAMALAAVEAFVGGGEQPLDLEVVRAGFAGFTSPGRLEIVRRSPTVMVDAAHNPAGALVLRRALNESFTFTKVVGLISILADKDVEEILQTLEPALDEVVISRNSSPRATDPTVLGRLAAEIFGDDRVTVVPDLSEAIDTAAGLADEGGVAGGVLATGSVVTAADVRMLLGVTDT